MTKPPIPTDKHNIHCQGSNTYTNLTLEDTNTQYDYAILQTEIKKMWLLLSFLFNTDLRLLHAYMYICKALYPWWRPVDTAAAAVRYQRWYCCRWTEAMRTIRSGTGDWDDRSRTAGGWPGCGCRTAGMTRASSSRGTTASIGALSGYPAPVVVS